MLKRFAGIVLACSLAGCGSSSTPAGPPPTSASSTSSIGTSGGSVSTTLNGQTVTATFAPSALAGSASVKLTVYAQSALPLTFQALKRETKSLPTGSTYLAGFVLDTGGVAITKAPSISASTSATIASGSIVRLAGSTGGSFADVDTASNAGGTLTNAGNPAYPGPTLDSANVVYTFYSVPSASANPAPTPAFTISGASSVTGGSSATYTASETGNGFPYLGHAIAFGLDNPALGSIVAATGVFTATSAAQIAGNITTTDSATGGVGKYPVQVLSSRPASVGDSLSYTGTISTTVTNYAIATPAPASSSSPAPGTTAAPAPTPAPVSQTQSGTVTESVSVTATPSAGNVTIASDEVDKFQLSSLETKTTSTIAYSASGANTNVQLLKALATDSNGSSYETDYTATSGLLAVLPETTGSFGPNDASRTYSETDPGITGSSVTEQRVTATDGSYTDTVTNVDTSQNIATAAANFTGNYSLFGFYDLAFAAPKNGSITIAISQLQPPDFTTYGSDGSIQPFNWIPSSAKVPYAETDTVQTGATIDAACAVPAKYGTTANLVTQTVTSIDAVFGTIDQTTTKSFDVVGVGTVCIELNDAAQIYYDYTGQEGFQLITYSSVGPLPLLTTSSTETLGLASAKVAGQPVSTQSLKSGASLSVALPISRAAVAAVRDRFVHAVRLRHIQAVQRLAASLHRSPGGVR